MSESQFHVTYRDANGRRTKLFRADSHPELATSVKPTPIQIHGVTVIMQGRRVLRFAKGDIGSSINEHMVPTGDDFLCAVYSLSTPGDLLDIRQNDQATRIELAELNDRGGVLQAFEFNGCEFLARTTVAVATYTLEGLIYSFSPDKPVDLDIVRVDERQRRRGRRIQSDT